MENMSMCFQESFPRTREMWSTGVEDTLLVRHHGKPKAMYQNLRALKSRSTKKTHGLQELSHVRLEHSHELAYQTV